MDWRTVQVSELRDQGFPDHVVQMAKEAYYERVTQRGPSVYKTNNAGYKKHYPKTIGLIELLISIGNNIRDPGEASFNADDVAETRAVGYTQYAKAVSQMQTDKWYFNNQSLLPYPDKNARDSTGMASAEAIKAYTDSYGTSLSDFFRRTQNVQGKKGGILDKQRQAQKAISDVSIISMSDGIGCLKAIDQLLAMLDQRRNSLTDADKEAINTKLRRIESLDQRELLKFIYIAVSHHQTYGRVVDWLMAGNATGVGFTKDELNRLASKADDSGVVYGVDRDFMNKLDGAENQTQRGDRPL